MSSIFKSNYKIKHPDEEVPDNFGKKWLNEEEETFLEELSQEDYDLKEIARTHGRSVGGIKARQQVVAYRLHTQNTSIDEIMRITRLEEEAINETIERFNNREIAKKEKQEQKLKDKEEGKESKYNKNDKKELIKDIQNIKSDIQLMKDDIAYIKKTVKDMILMISDMT